MWPSSVKSQEEPKRSHSHSRTSVDREWLGAPGSDFTGNTDELYGSSEDVKSNIYANRKNRVPALAESRSGEDEKKL